MIYGKEDHTYREIRERSVEQWLSEMSSHEDIAVRCGVQATRDYIADLKKQVRELEDKNRLKDSFLKRMKKKLD